jgi:hypothetical protein
MTLATGAKALAIVYPALAFFQQAQFSAWERYPAITLIVILLSLAAIVSGIVILVIRSHSRIPASIGCAFTVVAAIINLLFTLAVMSDGYSTFPLPILAIVLSLLFVVLVIKAIRGGDVECA